MQVPLGLTMGLLVAMTTKHLLADFFFQTTALARGKAADTGWLKPLAIHAGAHALITLLIALAVYPPLSWLAPVEWALHACIDRMKVVIARGRNLDTSKNTFWWLFGIDQYLHQITNIGLVLVFLLAMA